ncbi:MAG: hypothetical protein C0421_00800 [Hyphomonas sp.]|uniref:hypothetical protein n=1 Tax=Hyphomonas sp. TaxID=87 RepID=UPI0025C465E5|nr:hypothetical protein [Hyphomonas sp.]MBA4337367.1 hypothetical protein [Hyphomonas sp.]
MRLSIQLLSLAVIAAAPASAQALIVWSGEAKACGNSSFNTRNGYSIEHFEHSNQKIIGERRSELKAANKQAGGGWFWSDVVPHGSCVAVAKVQKKVSGCAYSTTSWRIGKSREEAMSSIESMADRDSNIEDIILEEVRCAVPENKKNKDTMFGVRG